MKTSSAKAKGRRLQQQVAERIRATFNLPETDVKSLPMGAQGCDVWLSQQALEKFPFAIECKNVEKINIWKAWEQAKTNAESAYPAVIFSRNRSDILVTISFDLLLDITAGINERKTKT